MSALDTELFELCKQVYKRTGWHDLRGYVTEGGYGNSAYWYDETISEDGYYPRYTSDYLLEKLPHEITSKDDWGDEVTGDLGLWKTKTGFTCGYIDGESGFMQIQSIEEGDKYYTEAEWNSDTALKALLKLVIALDDAGELNHA